MFNLFCFLLLTCYVTDSHFNTIWLLLHILSFLNIKEMFSSGVSLWPIIRLFTANLGIYYVEKKSTMAASKVVILMLINLPFV